MRIAVITDRKGTILGMASCQLYGDNGVVGEVEIRARSLQTDVSSNRDVDELQSHLVELPDRLVGKGFEEIQQLAYLDLSGDQPKFSLHKETGEYKRPAADTPQQPRR